MKDILKKQTQQLIFDRLRIIPRERLAKINDKMIWGLVDFIYATDTSLQIRSILGVMASRDDYFAWAKEVIDLLK